MLFSTPLQKQCHNTAGLVSNRAQLARKRELEALILVLLQLVSITNLLKALTPSRLLIVRSAGSSDAHPATTTASASFFSWCVCTTYMCMGALFGNSRPPPPRRDITYNYALFIRSPGQPKIQFHLKSFYRHNELISLTYTSMSREGGL